MAIQLLPLHAGDALTSYTAAAISKIGLWDERFCNIGWQDLDYWFRVRAALATLRAYASGAAGRATVMRKYRVWQAINFAGDRICFTQKDMLHQSRARRARSAYQYI